MVFSAAQELLQQAVQCFAEEDLEGALGNLNEAIRLDPNAAVLYEVRGSVYRLQQDFSQAIADLSYALALAPRQASVFGERGLVYLLQGNLDEVRGDLDECIRLNPSAGSAHCNRGMVFMGQGYPDEALADFNTALQLDPADASAFLNRGLLFLSAGELDRAMKDFARAVEIDPALETRVATFLEDPKFRPGAHSPTGVGSPTGFHSSPIGPSEVERGTAEETPFDVNANIGSGETLLFRMASLGKIELVRDLLAKGAEVNVRDFVGETPLHAAVICGHLEVLRLLLEAGADVNARGQFNRTPIEVAERNEWSDIAALLQQYRDRPAKVPRVQEDYALRAIAVHYMDIVLVNRHTLWDQLVTYTHEGNVDDVLANLTPEMIGELRAHLADERLVTARYPEGPKGLALLRDRLLGGAHQQVKRPTKPWWKFWAYIKRGHSI